MGLKSFFRNAFGLKTKPTEPVTWRFTVKKGVSNMYNVHITGFIAYPWRLYVKGGSPLQEGKAVTKIIFIKKDNICFINGIQEMGNLKEELNTKDRIKAYFYSSVVNYVQEVHVFNLPEIIEGTVLYTPSMENRCMKLMEKDFQIELKA